MNDATPSPTPPLTTAAPATAPPTLLATVSAAIGARLRAPRTNAELAALAGNVGVQERMQAIALVWGAVKAAVDEPDAPSSIEPAELHAAFVSLGMKPSDHAQNIADLAHLRDLRDGAAEVPKLEAEVRAAVQHVVACNAKVERLEAELKAAKTERGMASAMHSGCCESVAAALKLGPAAEALEADLIERGAGPIFEAEHRERAAAAHAAAVARRENEERLGRESLAAQRERFEQTGKTDAQLAAEVDPHRIAIAAQLGLESRASREAL